MSPPVHRFELSPSGPHVCHPPRVITQPSLDPRFFEPLVLLDLGVLFDDLAGHHALCVGFATGAVDETFVVQQDGDTWTLVDVDGSPPADPTRGSEWAETFEEGPATFAEVDSGKAHLIEAASAYGPEDKLWLQLGEPVWVQSPDPPRGDGWRFVARVDSYYMHGSVFVFYDPSTRRAHHLKQFS